MRRDIGELSLKILQTSPIIQHMKRDPKHPDWTALARLSEKPELAAFHESLSATVQDTFRSGSGLSFSGHVGYADCASAAELTKPIAETAPGAALVLTVAAVIAWTRSGDDIYGLYQGRSYQRLHDGWNIIPHACAIAGVRARAYWETVVLIEHTYDLVHSVTASTRFAHPVLAKYRGIARLATEAHEACIRDLADDLRAACSGNSSENFRAEFAALLWSLGYIPQSSAFGAGTALPSRQLCQLVIRNSVRNLPEDQLTQYIWLAMRDRGPFDLRQHESIFANINFAYTPHRSDAAVTPYLMAITGFTKYVTDCDPNAVVASVLISWFKGSLTDTEIEALQLLVFLYGELKQTADDRVRYLFDLICVAKVRSPTDPTNSNAEAIASMRSDLGTTMERKREWQLSLPHVQSGTTWPLGSHDIIEAAMSHAVECADPSAADEAFDFLEEYRRSGDCYWHLVQPVLPTELEAKALEPLLELEKALLVELRGAYFMMLTPRLPNHYRWFELSAESYRNSGELSEEQGRKQMERILAELTSLYRRMEKLAPAYVRSRQSTPSWDHVLKSLAADSFSAAGSKTGL